VECDSKAERNLGLHYDLSIPAYPVDNYWGLLDQTYPGWQFVMPGVTPGTSAHPFHADKKDFAPRFGLAYPLADKTVIHSGYGIYYQTGRFKFRAGVWMFNANRGGPWWRPSAMWAPRARKWRFSMT
jgi:hypothetical protein